MHCTLALNFFARSALLLGLGAATAVFAQDLPSHIEDAAVGEWTAIGENTLEDVRADLSEAPPGFRKNIAAIMSAWSTAAFDSRKSWLIVHGGGHRDYDGNEFYAFDVTQNNWIRLNEPSLFDPTQAVDSLFPDGRPLAVHTYDLLEANPLTGVVYRLSRNTSTESNPGPENEIWGFQTGSREWQKETLEVAEWFGRLTRGSSGWDPVNNMFWTAVPDQGTWIRYGSFDPTSLETRSYSVANPFAASGSLVSEVGYREGTTPILLTLIGTTAAAWSVGTDNVELWTLNGDTGFQNGTAVGLTYDDRRDVFWIYDELDRGTLYRLNPQTRQVQALTPPGDLPTEPYDANNGLYGRFRYVPEYDVLIMVNRVDARVFMYKPEDWLAAELVKPNSPVLTISQD